MTTKKAITPNSQPPGGKLVERKTRVVEIGLKLRQMLEQKTFAPGDKLPSQAELSRRYDVSRTVIREAIARLQAKGLVEVRHGAGVFMLEPKDLPGTLKPVDRERVSSMIDLLELRAAIEIEAAGLAAQRRSASQDEAIYQALSHIEDLVAQNRPTIAADKDFHLAIADATNNSRFREILSFLGEAMIPRSALLHDAAATESSKYARQIHAEHHAIARAISARDSDAAAQAMRVHLKGSEDRYRNLVKRD